MADVELVTVRGTLVAAIQREYKGFRTQDGTDMPGGTTRLAYVVRSFEAAPVEVKFADADLFAGLRLMGEWTPVEIECELRGRGQALERKAVSVRLSEPAAV